MIETDLLTVAPNATLDELIPLIKKVHEIFSCYSEDGV